MKAAAVGSGPSTTGVAKRFAIIFSIFTAVGLVLVLTGRAYLGTIDDPYIREFLAGGDTHPLMLSHPLSVLLARLYELFPGGEWLSLVYALALELGFALYAWYCARVEEGTLRLLMVFAGGVAALFAWSNATVTFATLFLVAMAIPLARVRPVAFWGLLVVATLLRETIVMATAPLLLVAFALNFDKNAYDRKSALLSLLLGTFVLWNLFSPRLDADYARWLRFYDARVYFVDLGGKDKAGVLNERERALANSWFIQDEALLPSQKVVRAAGSHTDLILYRLAGMKLRHVLSRLYHNKAVLVVAAVTLYLLFAGGLSWRRRALYLLFAAGFFLLFFIRDVERVTYPLLFLWMAPLTADLLRRGRVVALRLLFAGVALAMLADLPLYGKRHDERARALHEELTALMHRHPGSVFEPGIHFPLLMDGTMMEAMDQNRLFEEEKWIGNDIVPAGWMSRHPYFYEVHGIDADGVRRKFRDYREFMLSPRTLFVGSKRGDDGRNETILKMYDEIYLSERPGCRHVVEKVDESEHFALARVRVVCEEKERGKP